MQNCDFQPLPPIPFPFLLTSLVFFLYFGVNVEFTLLPELVAILFSSVDDGTFDRFVSGRDKELEPVADCSEADPLSSLPLYDPSLHSFSIL